MNTVRLITCNTLIDAHFIQVRLNNEGIECFLTNENSANLLPLFNNMLGSGVQVIVDISDVERAQEIIKDKLNPIIDEMICPHCGSNKIKLGIGNKKGIKILNIFLTLLLWLPMGNMKPKYYCKSCGKEVE